ncbi:hypothetical protein BJ165DRAFT_1443819 [Panaeolus papilionaceus]|nr:hypothetical protein BJ165DRAFT_1443819 [Panaeolus papilionaceus]
MLTHRGFSAWIVSEGCTVPEYLVAVDEPTHRVSCWIPATVGESFSVFWQDHTGGIDTSSFITLDGVTVPGRFLFGDGMASRSGVRVSKTTERPFVFASIAEEGTSTSSGPVNKEIGMITLKIKRVKRVTIRPANPIQELPSVTTLGKRKAGDVRIEFGQDEQPLEEQAATTWGTVPYDEVASGQSTSYVSFLFRYRTREFLEAQGIITEPVRKTAPTSTYQQPQPIDGQQRSSLDNLPPAKPTAEFTPEPESDLLTTAPKKPRLGSSTSRPTHPVSIFLFLLKVMCVSYSAS